MTVSELVAELKRGVSGAYFFYGCEEYLKRLYIGRIRRSVLGDDDTLSSFNHYVLKWEESSPEELEGALGSVPMMAEKTLVELHCDFSKIKSHADLADMFSAFDEDSCVFLVVAAEDSFDGGNPAKNKPSEGYKVYSKIFKMVEFPLQTPSELKKWILRRLGKDHVDIGGEALELILNRCGRDMFHLSGELDKLIAISLQRDIPRIDEELVLEITVSSEEDDAFALANAIMNGDRSRALHELAGCKRRQEKAPAVLGSVSRAVCDMLTVSTLLASGLDKSEIAKKMKMHEYRAGLYVNAVRDTEPARIRAAAERLREADLLLKSTRLDYIALERFICTIPSRSRTRRR